LNTYAKFSKRNNAYVTTLPKKTEAGNPDFRIWNGTQEIADYRGVKKIKCGNGVYKFIYL
jgi:hypothetical protein